MKIRKYLNVYLFFSLIALTICAIISYFIIFKIEENALPISEIFPEDTPIFFGIDDISSQLKKINNSQTKLELEKLGFYNDLNSISKFADERLNRRLGISLTDIIKHIDRDAGIAFDLKDNKLSFLIAVKTKENALTFQNKLEKILFGRTYSEKHYKNVVFKISEEGSVFCFYKNYFIYGNNEDFLKNLIDVINKEKKSLAENRLFLKIQKALEYNTGYLGFINLTSLNKKSLFVELLMKKVEYLFKIPAVYNLAFNEDFIKITKIEAIGLSGNILGEEIIQKNCLLLPKNLKEKILKNLYNNNIEKLRIDKIISDDFNYFIIGSFGNALSIYDFIKYLLMKNFPEGKNKFYLIDKLFKAYEINFKRDFIGSLGKQLAIVQKKEGDKLFFLIAIETKDDNKITLFLKKLNVLIEKKFYGMKLRKFNIREASFFSLEDLKGNKLIYGRNKNYLYFSNYKGFIIKSIDAYQGVNTILKNKEYKNCKSKVGDKNIFISYNKGYDFFSLYLGTAVFGDEERELKGNFISALNKIVETSEKECGQMKRGAISDDGFIIQSYSPLIYGYAFYLKEMMFILKQYLLYRPINFDG